MKGRSQANWSDGNGQGAQAAKSVRCGSVRCLRAGVRVGYESKAYTLRRIDVPVRRQGAAPLRVLHLSDLHMRLARRAKQEWLRDLGRLLPDLVVLTGDVLSRPDAGAPVLKALGPLLDAPGVFVPGNNDYYAPQSRTRCAI